MNRIFIFLFSFILIKTTTVSSQTNKSEITKLISCWYEVGCSKSKYKDSITSYDKYLEPIQKERFDKNYSHKIDTILKLKNNNYLIFVYNYNEDAPMMNSASYDIFEISKKDTSYFLVRDVLGLCDNLGGGGMADYDYKVTYLNEKDYLLVLKSTTTHQGSYTQLLIILNSCKILFDSSISIGYQGGFGDESFDELVKINQQNKKFKSILFTYKRLVGSYTKHIIKETTYQIDSKDINLEFNAIMNIKKTKESIYKLNL